MFTTDIKLKSIDNAMGFSNDIRKVDSDIDLGSGRYIIDAKSVMGLFSLDLSKKITLTVHTDDEKEISRRIIINYILNDRFLK